MSPTTKKPPPPGARVRIKGTHSRAGSTGEVVGTRRHFGMLAIRVVLDDDEIPGREFCVQHPKQYEVLSDAD